MLLKKLELHGFKSFGDKTQFDLGEGLTAFVGPNGCGKSNIVDAVRWILGEQRPKAVRGTQMSDVIFNGTARRRSLGYAEASLTFLNTKGILPSDYTELCITRRLYRSGESEYFINRQPCRLRDIRQLFLDTGIGVDTYSIIEQGRVNRFIQANAKERRVIFEEAAGISRYKAQRREAQNRLERTCINLQKVEIRLEEQRKQLRSIRYQAAKARRYRKHTARLRELVLSISVKDYGERAAKRKALEDEIAGLEQQHAALLAEIERIESVMQSADAEITRLDQARLDKGEALHKVETRTETARAGISHNQERIKEFEEEIEHGTRSIWTLNEKLRRTREEKAAAERELEAIRETIERQARSIAEESRKADAAGEECRRLSGAIEDWKNRTVEVIERATTLRNELHHMDSGRGQELARRSRLLGQQGGKEAEIQRIEAQIERLAGQRDEISGRLADRSSTLRERRNELAQGQEYAETVDSRLRDMRHQEAKCRSRCEILEEIEMHSEDVEAGVKRLLRSDNGERVSFKIQGMVADLVRADLKHAAAIETALGDAAQYVVTLSEDAAGAAISLLRTDRSGRAGLIPLGRTRGLEAADMHLAREKGVVGRACDLVRYRPQLEPLVRHLLGNTWVVDNLASALSLSNNGGGDDVRFVTLDGERVDPSGVIVGGEPLPRAGIVSRKSELEAVRAELGELADAIAGLETERGRISQHLGSLRDEADALRKEIEEGSLEKLTNENEILNLRRRQKILGEESALLTSEIAEIDETVRSFDEQRTTVERDLAETTSRREQVQAEVEAARRTLGEQQAAAARLGEEVTRLKVQLAGKETQRGGLEHGIVAAGDAVGELESSIALARKRVEELRARQTDAGQAIAEARSALEDLGREKELLESEIAGIGAAQERARAQRAADIESRRAARGRQDEFTEKLHGLRLEEQKHRVHMEELSERVFGEQGVRVEEIVAEASGAGEDQDWDAVSEEIAELREKIRRMGGVNEDAIDEEAGLDITIAQTESQRDDLLKAGENLRAVIRKLNRVSRQRFQKTFEEVRKHFQEVFRRLFGGGHADLVLQEDEPDVLEAGIEVLACPPGKDLRSITLLSGGEKTMTTIALLFAIFRAKPSPFCILDEVDAALDESNVDRFVGMLKEFLAGSQFIVITHSKRTISAADVLYGITMQEKGVSKKVAVQIEDAVQMLN